MFTLQRRSPYVSLMWPSVMHDIKKLRCDTRTRLTLAWPVFAIVAQEQPFVFRTIATEADIHESYVHCIELHHAVMGPELNLGIQ